MSTLFVNERVNTSKRIKGNWSTHLSILSNIPRKEVSAAPKRNKPGQDLGDEISETAHTRSSSKGGSSSRMHIRTRTALHACNTMSAVHVHSTRLPTVGRSIPSTLRRDLRSLSEMPSTLRRNLRSIAVSFFLPCEHNNRKADRIAFLNAGSTQYWQ